jgi:hypothetical protein
MGETLQRAGSDTGSVCAGMCVELCTPTTCSGNGRCMGMTGECQCYAGWYGQNCSFPDDRAMCPANPDREDFSMCQNNLVGLEHHNGFNGEGDSCKHCGKDAYLDAVTGICEPKCTFLTTCHARGRCMGLTGECQCFEGWDGANCDIDVRESCRAPSPEPGICPIGSAGKGCRNCAKDYWRDPETGECSKYCNIKETCSGNGRCSDGGECLWCSLLFFSCILLCFLLQSEERAD